MKLGELQKGEKFKFNNRIHTKLNKVNSHTKFEHDIFDCMDDEGRHRPFRDDTQVEPLQQRLGVEK